MKPKSEPLSPELREVMQTAETLASLSQDQWAALTLWFGKGLEEAMDRATEIETPEEKRAGWAGRAGGLRELLLQLTELRTGNWKQWPAVREWQKSGGDIDQESGD